MSYVWFRMYTDFLEDPKMLSLAFEDQRHFVGILALKSAGTLDQDAPPDLMDKIVAQRLWIDRTAISEVKRRLFDVGLIDMDWQPVAWEKRQKRSDHDPTGAERQRKIREKKRNALRNAKRNAPVTLPEENRIEKNRKEETKTYCASVDARRADFERFWEAFSYKKGKEPAWRSWKKITHYKPELVEQIIEAAHREARARPFLIAEKRTPKMAQGWLTDKRWLDEDVETPRPMTKQQQALTVLDEMQGRIADGAVDDARDSFRDQKSLLAAPYGPTASRGRSENHGSLAEGYRAAPWEPPGGGD